MNENEKRDNAMKWKVCGMRDQQNISKILELAPDYMGFIFYSKSPRFVGENWEGPGVNFPVDTQKVGVFVNEEPTTVAHLVERHQLDWLQLHGNESPQYCEQLSKDGFSLIKAVNLRSPEDLNLLNEYSPWVSYFLFDTPSAKFGGTGQTFDWSLLDSYDNRLPIFLSGGLSLENIESIDRLKKLKLEAIDVNSRFEIEPGLKDYNMLKKNLKKNYASYELSNR